MPRRFLALGAVVTAAVALVLVAPDATAATTTRVTGTVRYTSADAHLHPSRALTVQLRDADGTPGGRVVASGITTDTGAFLFTVSTTRAGGAARSLFVRATTAGAGFVVAPPGSAAAYGVQSSPRTATGTGQTVRLVAGSTTAGQIAFALADAMVTGVRYGNRVRGATAIPVAAVSFPDPQGSRTTGRTMRIKLLDGFDWDVVLHEYGHLVGRTLGIAGGAGGPHVFGGNAAEPPASKAAGLALAYSEGFATFFAITAEVVSNASATGIPGVGDSNYDDTQGDGFSVPIGTDARISGVGEDDELSIARSLWHFLVDPGTNLSDTAMISALVAAQATTLSTAVAALLPAAGAAGFDDSGASTPAAVARSNAFACVLTPQSVAPQLLGPASGGTVSATVAPTVTWRPNGAGPSHRLDRFTVQVWSDDWSARRLTSPTLDAVTTWTPTTAQWRAAVKPTDRALHVVVRGTGTDAPATGPYKSCAADVAIGGRLTITPFGQGIIPPPFSPACTPQVLPGLPKFTVRGTELTPSTAYDLVMHVDDGSWPDVPLRRVTTDAGGTLAATVLDVPAVPAARVWVLQARPVVAGAVAAGESFVIGFVVCWAITGTPPTADVAWGGMGASPATPVGAAKGGATLDTVTATARGGYAGSFSTPCDTSMTVSIRYTALDRTAAFDVVMGCPAAPTRGTTAARTSGTVLVE